MRGHPVGERAGHVVTEPDDFRDLVECLHDAVLHALVHVPGRTRTLLPVIDGAFDGLTEIYEILAGILCNRVQHLRSLIRLYGVVIEPYPNLLEV